MPPGDDEEANDLGARLLARIARHQPIASTVLKAFVEPTGAKRASLVLRAANRGLRLCESVGLDAAVERQLEHGLQGELDARAVRLGRVIAGHGEQGGERDYPGTAFLVLPLYAGSKFEGVINLTGLPGDRLPDDTAMARLSRLAEQAAHGLRTWRQLTRAESDSVHDPLTGLPNRRAFERALRRELDRAAREREWRGADSAWVGVALLDLDHFREVNNSLGHEAGDKVLHEIAQRLRTALRDLDVVARWGGEEFSVVLPLLHLPDDTPPDGFQQAAEAATAAILERARVAVSETPVDLAELAPPHRVTVSGGYVVGPLPGKDGTALMALADAALYEAKAQGRNRILGVGRGPTSSS
jgi:diguanylate cyclase (GGDEF)-like protein